MRAAASQDLHRAYRALLRALAYPGRPQALPAGDGPPLDLLLEAVWRDAPDQVRVADGPDASGLIESAPRGTPAEPEAGVTIIRVAGGERTPVVLEGPGVRGTLAVTLPLSRAELAARGRACAAAPMGVDLVLLDRDGTLIGLPRTARVREAD